MRGAWLPEEVHGPEQPEEAREEPQQGGAGPGQGWPGAGDQQRGGLAGAGAAWPPAGSAQLRLQSGPVPVRYSGLQETPGGDSSCEER